MEKRAQPQKPVLRGFPRFTFAEMVAGGPALLFGPTLGAGYEAAGYPLLSYSPDPADQEFQNEARRRARKYLPFFNQHSIQFAIVDSILFVFWIRSKAPRDRSDTRTHAKRLAGIHPAMLTARMLDTVSRIPPTLRHSITYEFSEHVREWNVDIRYDLDSHIVDGTPWRAAPDAHTQEAMAFEKLRTLHHDMIVGDPPPYEDLIGSVESVLQTLMAH